MKDYCVKDDCQKPRLGSEEYCMYHVQHDNLKVDEIALKNLDRESARYLKNYYEDQRDFIRANKFYECEMKARTKELDEAVKKDFSGNIKEWLVFKVHGLISNHSQDWLLALVWFIILGFILDVASIEQPPYGNTTMEIFFFEFAILFVFGFFLFCFRDRGLIFLMLLFLYFYNGFFLNDFYLSTFADAINPFATLTGHISFILLLLKFLQALVAYQFIVSIRKNTRGR